MGTFPDPLIGLPRVAVRRLGSWRWDGAAFWLLVASLASPSVAAAETGEQPVERERSLGLVKSAESSLWSRLFARVFDADSPPWAVEAPGAAGARFGLGLDLFFERQESLRITSMEQGIRTRDLLTGREESGVVRTDPGLLNRKFDLRWDLAGTGVQPAVSLHLPRALGIYPTLVFQAAEADVSLDFHDRNRPGDSSSLDGRGPLLGTGLDLTRALCRNCPWFAGASYRFQKLPRLTVDRAPPFGPPGFEILEDEVRLSRDVQEASTRVGYMMSGKAVTSYLGVSHRWTNLEIEDHLQYRDPFQEVETSLDSRTKLESDVTLALAGVEARLGPRLFSRVETSVGEKDWGALFRVVYLGRGGDPTDRVSRREAKAKVKRGKQIAEEIAPGLAEIEAAFLAGWKSLTVVEGPGGKPAYIAREVEDLLRKTEEDILNALGGFPEMVALADWVPDEFNRIRGDLGLTAEKGGAPGGARLPMHVAFASFTSWSQGRQESIDKGRTDAMLKEELERAREMARLGPTVTLFFETHFVGRGGTLQIFPRYHRDPDSPAYATVSSGKSSVVYRGSYVFDVYKDRQKEREPFCAPGNPGTVGNCPLKLLLERCQVLWCDDRICYQKDCSR